MAEPVGESVQLFHFFKVVDHTFFPFSSIFNAEIVRGIRSSDHSTKNNYTFFIQY